MTSRVYGATEDKILAQLERNLEESRGMPWRVLWSLIDGAAGTLRELGVDPPVDLVEIRTFGDPEPRYVPIAPTARPEFWDGDQLTADPDWTAWDWDKGWS